MASDFKNLLIKSEQNYKVAQKAKNLKCFDVAISRYYYSIYQLILYIIRTSHVKYEPQKGSDSHYNTYTDLVQVLYGDPNYRTILISGNNSMKLARFDELRKTRNRSDYTEKVMSEIDYEKEMKYNFNPYYDLIMKFIKEKETAI